MGGNCIMRVDKLENGYEVEIYDEKIRTANEKPKSSWHDTWKGYAFTTAEEALAFIGQHFSSLKPPPDAATEYSAAFKTASEEE